MKHQHPTPSPDDLGPLPDHKSKADLELMADAMRALSPDMRQFFAYSLVHGNLMRMQEGETQQAIDLARERGVLQDAMKMMFLMVPETVDAIIEEAIKHCLNGKDETDPKSAGGWNEDEVGTAYAALYVARGGLTIPFGATKQ